jgi:hypothetical protein
VLGRFCPPVARPSLDGDFVEATIQSETGSSRHLLSWANMFGIPCCSFSDQNSNYGGFPAG